MNFEDKISIQGAVYSDGYVKVGNAFYMIDDDGQPDTQRRYEFPLRKYDEDGNPVSVTDSFWIDFGKCIILPNQQAKTITLVNGGVYTYSYEVYLPLNKKKYPLIPREGDVVKIYKKDGTIESEKEVKGFVTLKKRYLKLWL